MGGELRGQFGMIFLETYVAAAVFEFSYDHLGLLWL
jgi:hypothetical protein